MDVHVIHAALDILVKCWRYLQVHEEDENHIVSSYTVCFCLLLGLHCVTYMCRCYNYSYIILDYCILPVNSRRCGIYSSHPRIIASGYTTNADINTTLR